MIEMGFIRTVTLMILGYVALKTLKRAMSNIEAQQAKAKVKEPQPNAPMKRLKLDPITGDYVPEA